MLFVLLDVQWFICKADSSCQTLNKRHTQFASKLRKWYEKRTATVHKSRFLYFCLFDVFQDLELQRDLPWDDGWKKMR